MAATARTPRNMWIEEGLRALGAGGPDAVRVDVLAKKLGATRGSFHWHFENRGALLEEMLTTWEQQSTDEVIARVETEGGDARAKVRRAGILTFSEQLRPVDLAVRDWARRDAAVAARLRRVDNRRMEYTRTLFGTFCDDEDEIEARSLTAFCLAVGSHFLAADHGGRSRAQVVERAASLLLA